MNGRSGMEKHMRTIQSLEDLDRFREEIIEKRRREAAAGAIHVAVGMGSCGIAAGAREVLQVFQEGIDSGALKNVTLSQTGCVGLCADEPIVEVSAGEAVKVTYGGVMVDEARRIIREHITGGRVVEELVIDTTQFPTI